MQSDHLAPGTESAASPGVRLRRAREARGESVHEAAFAIKLSPRQIEALENDDFAALPGMAFVRGFARNYARYLGLDAAPLLDGIGRLAGADQPDLSPIRNADGDLPSGGGTRRGSFPAGAVVAVLLVLLGVGWYFDWFRTSAAAPGEAPPATEEGAGGKRLSFRFGGDSWIEVRDASGTILHSGTNRAGSSRVVQGTPPFRLVVGNSANVVLEQDGQAVDLAAHTRGSVARLTLP